MKYPGMYIYPPRPSTETKFKSQLYERLKQSGWIAQVKANGQRSVEYFHPDGKLMMWNRHKAHHRNYTLPSWLDTELRAAIKIKPDTWEIIDSELLHAKDATVKNTFYLYDLLVHEGEYLTGTSYQQRHKLLMDIAGASEANLVDGWRYQVSEHIWVARNLPPEMWDDTWGLTSTSWIEGFVLKNPVGRLLPGITPSNNGDWMIRCRKLSNSGHVGRYG